MPRLKPGERDPVFLDEVDDVHEDHKARVLAKNLGRVFEVENGIGRDGSDA